MLCWHPDHDGVPWTVLLISSDVSLPHVGPEHPIPICSEHMAIVVEGHVHEDVCLVHFPLGRELSNDCLLELPHALASRHSSTSKEHVVDGKAVGLHPWQLLYGLTLLMLLIAVHCVSHIDLQNRGRQR